ncbi:mRNA cleavage and polyadenylation factor II complex, subunit CFT1 (CPSF subunit) [Ceraceosorus bombacis]|uniref:mRNA cleavage and polyadenylation factor II complex, subunit CFT1 (CPSF subunit) n=1 Tax=Ceraceosorus bombacis TaxID=401625 RepID=A0A0P1BB83_9BASI|nr:mRNA cleavage and polyadenylation factor II complex, subunit CFT1 (CPSF subunit) [Ceraceosorus bombacis]
MSLSALHLSLLPASGTSHLLALHLTHRDGAQHSFRGERLRHLILVRDDCVRIFEVRRACDAQIRLHHLRTHQLFGNVMGLGAVDASAWKSSSRHVAEASGTQSTQAVLFSFGDAKMALMEWDDEAMDLVTVSIHTYQRAPQMINGSPPHFQNFLRTDPVSRCAVMLLPQSSIAVLPFYQDSVDLGDEMDLELLDGEGDAVRQGHEPAAAGEAVPYAPSFVLDLAKLLQVAGVRDLAFCEGFQRPTLAVLSSVAGTCTGRLNEKRDTCVLHLLTLDLSITSTHPILNTCPNLPHDVLYMRPCPANLGGGVLLVSPCALMHVDQAGNVVGLATSDWFALTSDRKLPSLSLPSTSPSTSLNGTQRHNAQINLANSEIIFPNDKAQSGSAAASMVLLFSASSEAYQIRFNFDGRTLESLSMELVHMSSSLAEAPAGGHDVEKLTPPACAAMIDEELAIVGSMIGPSRLVMVKNVQKNVEQAEHVKEEDDAKRNLQGHAEMEMDLDDDLYGDSARAISSAAGPSTNGSSTKRAMTSLELKPLPANIPALGPVHDLKMCAFDELDVKGEEASLRKDGKVLKTLATVGAAPHAGVAILERAYDACLASNDDQTTLFKVHADGETELIERVTGRTLAAGPLPDRPEQQQTRSEQAARLIRITERQVEVMDLTGRVLQSLLAVEEKGRSSSSAAAAVAVADEEEEELQVHQASLCGAWAALVRTDGQLRLYRVDRDALQSVQLPQGCALGANTYTCVSLLRDQRAQLSLEPLRMQEEPKFVRETGSATALHSPTTRRNTLRNEAEEEEEIDYGEEEEEEEEEGNVRTSTTPARVVEKSAGSDDQASSSKAATIWLSLVGNDGRVHICALPSLEIVWSSNSILALPQRLSHTLDDVSSTEDEGLYVIQALLCHIGDALHLATSFNNGLIVVYEANTSGAAQSRLQVIFNKIFARQITSTEVAGPAVDGEVATLAASLTPLDRFAAFEDASIFVGGEESGWIAKCETGPLVFFPTHEGGLHSCAALRAQRRISPFALSPQRFLFTQFDMVCSAEMPDLRYDLEIPYKLLPSDRTYTRLAPHEPTGTFVVASESPQPFVLFDPEDQSVVQDPSIDPTPAYIARGSLELFVPGIEEPIDGFEFGQCEVVCAVELVTLKSIGTLSGTKDYLAVGTMISHGEDRPARGNTYIFDVVEVVPDPTDPLAKYRLRMLYKEDAKAPITCITDMNGYLVVAMGQKLFVRSLENDEWLVSIAFLDIPFQTTTLRRLNNFILLSDVHNSVWFIAFQESPYRLTVLGKDFNTFSTTCSDFLLDGPEMSIVAASTDKVLRLYDYAPTAIASQGGLKLLLRTEYQISSEVDCILMIPGAAPEHGGFSLQSELILGLMNGGVHSLVPVEEHVYHRLQLLQSQMVRNVQHFAGLNPRGHRSVRNDHTSRPLAKGILDGLLLSTFEKLSRPKMEELVGLLQGAMGRDGPDQALRDLAALRNHWGSA